jgi:YVTN family beta-propeller protein
VRKFLLLVLLLSLVLASSPAPSRTNSAPQAPEAKVDAKKVGAEDNGRAENVIINKGVRVEFEIEPASGREGEPKPIMEGEYAEVRFNITDAATGAPVSPLEPAVWISLAEGMEADIGCRDRISRYLQGMLSFQADIDLNKYFILIMNNDQSISVVDPLLGVSGITQLYAMIILKEPGEDWIFSPDGKLLFVTMPKADRVAVVDLENFKVIQNVEAGSTPVRVALQPDGRYLWVGNDDKVEGNSGVTVIDAQNYKVAAHIPTGGGHHEIAFSDDSLFAFVTNSGQGTVSVIDTQKLQKVKDLPVGKYPIAVQFSSLSQAAYVASRDDGSITVVDAARQDITATIPTELGLIALRSAPGGRWLFGANIKHNRVDVIDATKGQIAHTFEVGEQPHQFAFTDTYAYVRHLGTPETTLIPLAQLGKKATVALHTVAMGSQNPGNYPYSAIADSISPTGEWTAVVAANPADMMVYYYMEGMIGPMGSYPTYGRIPRAVGVVDRSVRETEKGVYAAKIRVPKAGKYSVAFLIDSPLVDHCFTFTAELNPLIETEKEKYPVRLEFLNKEFNISVGEPFKVKFSLTHSSNDEPLTGLKDVLVIATRMPGNWQERQLAKPLGEGRYEVSIVPDQPGVYLIAVGVPSFGVDMTELPYRSFRASKTARAEKGM